MKIAINGARGRMGRMVQEAAAGEPDIEVLALLETPGHPETGHTLQGPCGPLVLHTDPSAADEVDVGIDFSHPAGSIPFARALAARGIPVVIGTTGLSSSDMAMLRSAADGAPILVASNTSVGVHCLHLLSTMAQQMLGPRYDVEIVEIHHRHKRDAPSGTAMTLAEGLLGNDLHVVTGREGQCGPRASNELGVLAVRGGEVIGDHTIMFLGDHDRIEITHRAASRLAFAQGAISLARRLLGRAPGLVQVADLFREP
jgi:4-hydroxy-tetrahydrodipicolinate reductase